MWYNILHSNMWLLFPYNNDNEIIFISIETFTHSYIHDKQWKYGKVKKSWTYISDFPGLTSIYYGSIKSTYRI